MTGSRNAPHSPFDDADYPIDRRRQPQGAIWGNSVNEFENLVCEIFWKKGSWFQYPFHVELTKAEKRKIGCPTSPRWELDIVSYRGRNNAVILIERKSHLNSTGVSADDLHHAAPAPVPVRSHCRCRHCIGYHLALGVIG